jgi:hypothetical protein
MAKTMKSVTAPAREGLALTILVNPLPLARGAMKIQRGGVHATAKRPSRAARKRLWRRERDGLLV